MKHVSVLLNFALILLIVPLMMLSSCSKEINYPGYRLIEKRFVKEINADCYLFEHEKSGARILKIAADDPNKTFSIGFSTIPVSDGGTPHIMEHSVLNGSKKFPVKSPFDVLSKGSLNTYLNALTADDFTLYPVASLNEKDYFNLMNVYLDAVFYPRIYDDPRIFMQEGWHLELTDKDAPLEYKGVVYNEMKGAFSNPERELWYQIQKNLFPENAYRFSSGGYPSAIPSLTYEDFIDFHKKNYHPSNSYIMLYGDADLAKELEFIDSEYLKNFDRAEPPSVAVPNPAFKEPKQVSGWYPVIEGAPVEKQTYLALNWVIGSGADPVTAMLLDVLGDVLVNHESAPVRKALQEAGIGSDIYATNQGMLQNVFSIVVQNADAAEKEKFREIILSTLEKVCEEKIDRETLKGSINRLEFRLREGNNSQKGLLYNFRCIYSWLYTNNPFAPLEYEKQLAVLKETINNTMLEDLIRKEMVGNQYSLLMDFQPKPGLDNELAEKTRKELAELKKGMSKADIDTLVSRTKALVAFQKTEDSPDAIATIPMLKISDINKNAEWFEASKKEVNGVPTLHFSSFTNGIVYLNFWFDLRVLPEEKLPYAALLTQLLGKVDAGGMSYEQLDKSININTGGFNVSLASYIPGRDDAKISPYVKMQMKTTPEKLDTALDLMKKILAGSDFENTNRLLELLKRHQAQVESNVTQNGYGVAASRLESYYSCRGMFAEKTRGMDYYWFVTDLLREFNTDPAQVIRNLSEVYNALFAKSNLIAGATCTEKDFKDYSEKFSVLSAVLSDKPASRLEWKLVPKPMNEGILTASKVQYVLQGFNYGELGLKWDGKWNMLSQVISTDWLQTQVRVIGGAYGGFSSINKNGTMYFASYRDPNLTETLDNFKRTVDYLSKFEADSSMMTRYIIGTIANFDYPMTPAEKGEQAFRWYFEGATKAGIQAERDAILSTTAGDIKGMSSMVEKVLDQKTYCVYGNDAKLNANKALFKDLVKLQR